MSYVIYADGMMVWNTVINLAVLTLSTKLLVRTIKLKRIIFFSLITALITTVEYILTIGTNKYIHHILYVFIYLIMMEMYFSFKSLKGIFHRIIVTVISMAILYGGIGIFYSNQIPKEIKTITIIAFTTLIVLLVLMYSKEQLRTKANKLEIILQIKNKEISLTGFLDTGNTLTDPYSGLPVIILDYRVLKKIISNKAFDIVLNYHNTGEFDYLHMSDEADINFYPLPYRTVSTNFALMPAFRLNSLAFKDLNYEIEKIVCGISRFKLKNNNEYQVLLNESLKPNREEKFK